MSLNFYLEFPHEILKSWSRREQTLCSGVFILLLIFKSCSHLVSNICEIFQLFSCSLMKNSSSNSSSCQTFDIRKILLFV